MAAVEDMKSILEDNELDLNDEEEPEFVLNSDDDSSYEGEEIDDSSSRTLFFLCEEGQLDIALQRVKTWDREFPANASTTIPSNELAAIQQELFRKDPNTGNYCLHEILAGGTSGRSAPELVKRLVQRYTTMKFTKHKNYRTVFLAQPRGSHRRTILHWCAWCKTTPNILRMVLNACPEAMCLRDDKAHFRRTPLEIAQRYWKDDEITRILKAALQSYLPHRIQFCVHLCAQRLFVRPICSVDSNDKTKTTDQHPRVALLKPFDKKDRRTAGLSPRSWFVASVLGYALQREMKGVAQHIISFVGCGAKLEPKHKKKRKRKSKSNKT